VLDTIAIICGWAAAVVSAYAFWSKTMIPLRAASVAASVLAIVYAGWTRDWPILAANCAILPLNLFRLNDMRQLIADARSANREELNFDWLKPYMTAVDYEAGTAIFEKNDPADAVYVISEGQINLPELGVIIGPGSMLGEMGLFTANHKRMSGARCMGAVRAYRMPYGEFEQLYFQNPQFGLYLVRLMVRRLESNLGRYSGGRVGTPPAARPTL
jgi:CRP/FNR family cyclic AMP-dependent transcriptional regulator